MKLLDLFCCGGGAAKGYTGAGFTVTGIDIEPQPKYPYEFIQDDALCYLAEHGHEYDVIHASPPCQRYSSMTRTAKTSEQHPDLIAPTRALLEASGKPYIIENVVGAPLRDPVLLCGTMFPGLRVYRHRLFETNWPLVPPVHPKHTAKPMPKAGRGANAEGWLSVAGHFSDVGAAQRAMGIDWLGQKELAQAIPPAYTEYIGRQLLGRL